MSDQKKEGIKLTLSPFAVDEPVLKTPETPAQQEQALRSIDDRARQTLSSEELAQVDEFAKQIDITNATVTLQYGAGTQKKIAEFSDSALKTVRTQDLGETGDMIASLVGELKGFNDDIEDSGKKSIFRNAKKKIVMLKTKYDKVATSVGSIVSVLDNHQITLLKDIAVLDELYETNLTFFKELSMYIIAGQKKLEEERSATLHQLRATAERTGLPEDAQKAADFAAMCQRFEKKLYDLELTRMISIQMAPQIRLVQNNNTLMSEKIQSVIVNTIPLWKSQMIIALGLAHSQQALQAERAVTDMTNSMLRKNAEMLHQSTVEIARESERGIVDIETLTQTNAQLIATLDDVKKIQKEGHDKRVAAQSELVRIEDELKNKLLELQGS